MKRIGILFVLSIILILTFPFGRARAADLPEEAYVSGFIGHAQQYNLSCESRSAADWAQFWGYSVSENDVLSALARTDNPETGFVGSIYDAWGQIPPASYGTHATAIAQALQSFGLPAEARSGMQWDDIRAEISAGRPVIIWVIGQMWAGSPVSYTASDGETTTVAAYEHTMTLVGYTASTVSVVDAYSGLTQTYAVNSFFASWSVLGNRAVVMVGEPGPQPTLVPPGDRAQEPYLVQSGETLQDIALRYQITWQELAQLNQLDYPYTIYAGQELQIPGASSDTSPIQPATVETPVPVETVVPEPVGEEPAAAPTYTVQVGDTLVGLADRFQIPWQELTRLNGIGYPYFIFSGQVLTLPQDTPIIAETQVSDELQTPQTPETYIVQPGDYLMELSQRFQIDWMEIVRLNNLAWPYNILVGQSLRLR